MSPRAGAQGRAQILATVMASAGGDCNTRQRTEHHTNKETQALSIRYDRVKITSRCHHGKALQREGESFPEETLFQVQCLKDVDPPNSHTPVLCLCTRRHQRAWGGVGEWLKEFNTKRKGAMKRPRGNVSACYQVEEVRLVMVVLSRSPILPLQRRNYEDTNTNQEPLGPTRREGWSVQTVTLLVV